ncbi:MAG TPA: hypothetical protein VNY83_02290 [Solirubrobacterales bacterium]|jgi:hypothetical protein|nr:hypothetical protein [Solirubrobacterales bacterium]
MAEAPLAAPLPREEATGWVGHEVDDLDGAAVGSVHGFFADAGSGEPTWLIAKIGRRRARLVAIPLRDCAAATTRVWVAHERDAIRGAPVVDPTRPLLREHELTICSHYGIGERVGRAAEVAGRPKAAVTSKATN